MKTSPINNIVAGVGNTPLVRLYNLEKALKWEGQIWAKNEFLNPTGSFKDRGSITEIKAAITQGKKGVVCASTGNMAASLSSYAAKNKMLCVVVVPKNTPEGKLKQARICGAKIISIDGTYDDCVDKAKEYALENNFLLCGDYELRRIGQSTVGLELAQSDVSFDSFIVPVGNGTLGCAISQGFAMVGKFPSFIGVQGEGSDPVYKTWKEKRSNIKPLQKPSTIASAMKVGNPLDGNLTLEWINRTSGEMISVSDKEIQGAQNLLAEEEGIYVEKSAAATVAALNKLNNKNSNMVLILTGNGLKEGS